MKKSVEFVFDNYSASMKRGFYKVVKTMSSEDSVREVGLTIAKEAVKQGLVTYSTDIDDDRAIAIYVSSDQITNAEKGYAQSGFGIKYGINSDGSISFMSDFEPLHRNWRFSEIEELVSEGYIDGDSSKLIIGLPTGIGATPQEYFEWFSFMMDVVAAINLSARVFGNTRKTVANRKIRRIIKLWNENGIHYPRQVREFIDTKGEWKLEEVKKRLKLDEEYTIKLLTSLGYEAQGNSWRLTHSKDSISHRKRWMRNEKKYSKANQIYE